MHLNPVRSAAGAVSLAVALCAALTWSPLGSPFDEDEPMADVVDDGWGELITAVYDVISGPVGEARDWERMHGLFVPDARLMVSAPQPDGSSRLTVLSVADYIERSGAMLVQTGFDEVELARRVERYGNVVHVFSSYHGSWTGEDGSEQSVRGLNSFQLVRTGAGWKVVTILWEAEHPGNPIPARYLP